MKRPSLHVVDDRDTPPPADDASAAPVETVAQRVRRLQAEAKALATDHVRALNHAIADVETLADEIATGGDAYPPGVRDLARRLAEDCTARIKTLEAILARSS